MSRPLIGYTSQVIAYQHWTLQFVRPKLLQCASMSCVSKGSLRFNWSYSKHSLRIHSRDEKHARFLHLHHYKFLKSKHHQYIAWQMCSAYCKRHVQKSVLTYCEPSYTNKASNIDAEHVKFQNQHTIYNKKSALFARKTSLLTISAFRQDAAACAENLHVDI